MTGPYTSNRGIPKKHFEYAMHGPRISDDSVLGVAPEYLIDECLAAIDRADVVFAWLAKETSEGGLVEIGYARGTPKMSQTAGSASFRDPNKSKCPIPSTRSIPHSIKTET